MDQGAKKENLLTIGDLSKLTGITTHTLRIWERRYGSPKSHRLPSGHRRYPKEEVPRLRAIARALEAGYRASKVVTASMDELQHLLEPRVRSVSKSTAGKAEQLSGISSAPAVMLEKWMQAVHQFDDTTLTQGFHEEWGRHGPFRFILDYAGPFLEQVGIGWESGELSVAQEHFASEQIGDFLSPLWRRMNDRKSGPIAVLTTLPRESHRLGIQMCATVTALSSFKVVYLGLDTPISSIIATMEQCEGRLLAISISSSIQSGAARQDILTLRKSLDPKILVVAGGDGAPSNIQNVKTFSDFTEYLEWLNTLDTQ